MLSALYPRSIFYGARILSASLISIYSGETNSPSKFVLKRRFRVLSIRLTIEYSEFCACNIPEAFQRGPTMANQEYLEKRDFLERPAGERNILFANVISPYSYGEIHFVRISVIILAKIPRFHMILL